MTRFPTSGFASLLAAARDFADAQPALAGLLGRTVVDPTIERMREGLAYLGATLVDKTGEFQADGFRTLAEVVAPSLLRPFPAATIVELSADRMTRVNTGAEITTREPAPCRFRLVSDVDVGPLRVERARVVRGGSIAGDALQFAVSTPAEAGLRSAVGSRLRLYIDGSREVALLLLDHVLSHTDRCELTLPGGITIPLGKMRSYGTRVEDALAPEIDAPQTAFAFAREYFLLPEKFSFFELTGFDRALDGISAREAIVTIHFDAQVPGRVVLDEDALRPHCVPAVNLFSTTSEPHVVGPEISSFPVRVAGLPFAQGGVYAVVAANAIPLSDLKASPKVLPPLRRFRAANLPTDFPYAFSTELVLSPARTEADVVLTLSCPRGYAPPHAPHALSLNLLATNRARGGALRPGELTEPGAGFPANVRARNLIACSPYVPAATGVELMLQASKRAAIARQDTLFTLKNLLLSLLPRRGVEPAAVRANLARIAALASLEVGMAVDSAEARHGYRAEFTLDETPFRGLGDVALFLRLLGNAFEAHVSTNRFYLCEALCTKNNIRLTFPRKTE
ncbi:MAG: type VI secretion system baseplate subunit TssF [Polyangiaceae bacterium]|nr:type VI secretion system baseplate subunit TssF [Polyangiaceae bacterium]